MTEKLVELAKKPMKLSSGKLMIGPNERARSQYPGGNIGGGGIKGGGWGGGRWA